jgi:hypothetical protein
LVQVSLLEQVSVQASPPVQVSVQVQVQLQTHKTGYLFPTVHFPYETYYLV